MINYSCAIAASGNLVSQYIGSGGKLLNQQSLLAYALFGYVTYKMQFLASDSLFVLQFTVRGHFAALFLQLARAHGARRGCLCRVQKVDHRTSDIFSSVPSFYVVRHLPI